MLVCHCQRICDRTIRKSIRDGACSVEEVAEACGAGSRCGGCRPAIGALVDEHCAAEESPRRFLMVMPPLALRVAG